MKGGTACRRTSEDVPYRGSTVTGQLSICMSPYATAPYATAPSAIRSTCPESGGRESPRRAQFRSGPRRPSSRSGPAREDLYKHDGGLPSSAPPPPRRPPPPGFSLARPTRDRTDRGARPHRPPSTALVSGCAGSGTRASTAAPPQPPPHSHSHPHPHRHQAGHQSGSRRDHHRSPVDAAGRAGGTRSR
jgi:hypothetical protein